MGYTPQPDERQLVEGCLKADPKEQKKLYEKFYGKMPEFSKHLVPFGKLGVVGNLNLLGGKIANKKEYHVMFGYAENCLKDVYSMFDIQTEKVIKTKDVA